MDPALQILIAAEDSELIEVVKRAVESGGHSLTLIKGREQVAAAAREGAADLVFAAHKFSGLDGRDLIRQVKAAAPGDPPFGVLILDAEAESRPPEEGEGETDPDRYLYPPFTEQKLIQILDQFLAVKKLRDVLEGCQTQLKSIFRAAPLGIGLVSERTILDVNQRLIEMTGFTREELVGKNARVLYPSDSEYEYVGKEKYAEISETGTGTVETRFQRKDGEILHVLLSSTPLDVSDLKQGVTFSALDITERVRAVEDLEQSKQLLDKSQEMAHLGSWELDVTNGRLTWSDEVYRIFGIEPREFEVTYQAFLGFVHPDDREEVDAAYTSSLVEGRDSYEFEHRVIRGDSGEVRFVHEKCEHLRDENGEVIRSLGMVQDITERVQVREELEQHRDHLEEEVRERTGELRKLVNAMAGREVRMAEIKEENLQLRSQLEEAGLDPVV